MGGGLNFNCCCDVGCFFSCATDIRTQSASIPLAFTGNMSDGYAANNFNGTYSLSFVDDGITYPGYSAWQFLSGGGFGQVGVLIVLKISDVPDAITGKCQVTLDVAIKSANPIFTRDTFNFVGTTTSATAFCTSFVVDKTSTGPFAYTFSSTNTNGGVTNPGAVSSITAPFTITWV